MKFVLKQDLTIPAGTVFDGAATNRGGPHYVKESCVGFGKNYTGWLIVDQVAPIDAPDWFEAVE